MENKIDRTLYWTVIAHQDWCLHIAATSKGLCYVGSPNQPLEQITKWAAIRLPDYSLVKDDAAMQPYAEELSAFMQGTRQAFTVPVDCRGTEFQTSVWEALRGIPYGQTRSYYDIALQIDRPAAVRAVGAAIGANPVLITVPCHRVIGKNGALTGYRGGMEMKTKLLELERSQLLAEGGLPHASPSA
ncbi:methylated-DNA--[protein]-cysteine S-methyltransferase [Paenibacillus doosanensis]|uniref:methylated-DNA--[protein]-cysteine S-methyltransferase n=1 Tax=Paenibacillus doosanensis TaxID=1229154 RepID=UPI00217FA9F8|nr:methylated-DNA--[protein]-cysteine S-methyltransferase [Paenibacillus doosanensis]MCS7463800.1 methylated-DNA--[protein]-cysteine S-methyltransferase [Paenibacillus doosanensis]